MTDKTRFQERRQAKRLLDAEKHKQKELNKSVKKVAEAVSDVLDGEIMTPDREQSIRDNIESAELDKFLINLVAGAEVGGERLSLTNRAKYALALLNKVQPDMKAMQIEKKETKTLEIKNQATFDLINQTLNDNPLIEQD